MKFEIVEFYPASKKHNTNENFIGNMHVYLIEKNMDLRNIGIFKKQGTSKKLLFFLPRAYQYSDEKEGKIVFPVISFTSLEEHKEFISFLQEEGTKYVRQKLSDLNISSDRESNKNIEKLDFKN